MEGYFKGKKEGRGITMKSEHINILAVGAHPDDVEIGMGGTLAKYGNKGFTTAIVNLTKAELSSNGSVEERQREAENAAEVLKVSKRIQLSFPDRQLQQNKEDAIKALVEIIREYQPEIIFAPYYKDRHPDHGHCGEIVKEAVFSAGIRKFLPDSQYKAYRPSSLCYFQINGMIDPQFLIDISEYMDDKLEALACFKSQFQIGESHIKTPLNDGFLQRLEGRESILGFEAGVKYAEGFVSDKPVIIHDLLGETI